MAYTAIVQSAIVNGMVYVTIPALHMTQTFQAHIKPGTPCSVGNTALIILDEQRTPWVVTGNW